MEWLKSVWPTIKKGLSLLGTLLAIIALAVFMFTTRSAMFTLMSGFGIISVMLTFITAKEQSKANEVSDHYVIKVPLADYKRLCKIKELYAKEHPEKLIE